jgi:hypothetical protein
MINLLPDLRPRMRRADLDAMLAGLREAVAIDPVHAERFYKAYPADRSEGASIWVNTTPLARRRRLVPQLQT